MYSRKLLWNGIILALCVSLISNLVLQSNEADFEEARDRRAVFKLGQRLVQTARNSELDETNLRSYLQSLKALYHHDLQVENRRETSDDTTNSEP